MLDVLELKHLFLIVHIIEKEFIIVVSLRFNVGIVFLTSDLMEATRGQKHSSEAKNGMKESSY